MLTTRSCPYLGEEELSECEIGTETKRNTAQNESIGEGLLVDGETCPQETRDARDACVSERKNSGRGPYNSNSYNRARLRSKNATRSEDMEADDELVNMETSTWLHHFKCLATNVARYLKLCKQIDVRL